MSSEEGLSAAEIRKLYTKEKETLHPQIQAMVYLDMLDKDMDYAINVIYPNVNIPTLIRLHDTPRYKIKKSVSHMSKNDKINIIHALGATPGWKDEVMKHLK